MAESPPAFNPWLGVFETLRVFNGTPLFIAEHEAELRRAMAALGLRTPFDPAAARRELPAESGRWRWIVTATEARTLFTPEPPPASTPVALELSPMRVGSQNWDARFKTLSYLTHAQAAQLAPAGEALLINEHGHVASGARGNVFWRRGEHLFTAAHEAGCRCGVVRGFVLAHERVEQGHFPASDLEATDEIFLTGSMRGIIPVTSWQGRPLASHTTAQRLQQAYANEVARQVA
jgi:branched-subunit amino acid aminotransferase/4-amino-4-deoxychorismate lyase